MRVAEVLLEPEERAVYDITVDGEHEFFANGLLVHNSIDALRYDIVTTEKRWRKHLTMTVPNIEPTA